jgi:diguanylate cyclase (GGDEF)-like protein
MNDHERSSDELNDLVKLSFFAEIGTDIASSSTLEETLRTVMEHIGRVFAPEHWSILMRNRKSGDLTFVTVTGSAASNLLGKTLPRGRGIAGWIAENSQSVVVSDVSKDDRFDPEMDRAADFATESIVGVPLVSKGEVFGVIELINKLNGERFTPLDLKILRTIADFAAIAIERAYYVRVLKRVALLDPLTNVYNRRVLARNLEREQARVARYGTSFAVLMLDVDGFKEINDRYGHAAGDEVLKLVSRVLTNEVRKIDIVARYGGDEFIVLMPDSTIAAAVHVRDRVNGAIARAKTSHGGSVSVSIGVHEATAENVDRVIEEVDAAMYRDKRIATEDRSDTTFGDMRDHLQDLLSFPD